MKVQSHYQEVIQVEYLKKKNTVLSNNFFHFLCVNERVRKIVSF